MCNLYCVNNELTKGNLSHTPPGVADVPRCHCCVFLYFYWCIFCISPMFSPSLTGSCCWSSSESLGFLFWIFLDAAQGKGLHPTQPFPVPQNLRVLWVPIGHGGVTIPWRSSNHSQKCFGTHHKLQGFVSPAPLAGSDALNKAKWIIQRIPSFHSAGAREPPIIQGFWSHQNAPDLVLSCCLTLNTHISTSPFSQGVRNNPALWGSGDHLHWKYNFI